MLQEETQTECREQRAEGRDAALQYSPGQRRLDFTFDIPLVTPWQRAAAPAIP